MEDSMDAHEKQTGDQEQSGAMDTGESSSIPLVEEVSETTTAVGSHVLNEIEASDAIQSCNSEQQQEAVFQRDKMRDSESRTVLMTSKMAGDVAETDFATLPAEDLLGADGDLHKTNMESAAEKSEPAAENSSGVAVNVKSELPCDNLVVDPENTNSNDRDVTCAAVIAVSDPTLITSSPCDGNSTESSTPPVVSGENEGFADKVASESAAKCELLERDEEGGPEVPPIPFDEDSNQSATPSESNAISPQKRTRITKSKLMLQSLPQGVGADALFEYKWPINDDHAEYWMLQEQVSVFLDIKSFRRKYPDLEKRQIDIEERHYIIANGVVTEMQCDLGLTALRSEDISDLMLQDYPEKYDEYAKVLQKREEQRLAKKHQELQDLQSNAVPSQTPVSKMDIKKMTEKAVRSAANYNAMLMREKREERKHYYDIATSIVQYPKDRKRPLPPEMTRPGTYPVALLKGQYSDSYNTYTSKELNYLPVRTALYEPPLRISNPYIPLPPHHEDVQPSETVMLATNPSQPVAGDTAVSRKHLSKLFDAVCLLCGGEENKKGNAEKCIRCTECRRHTHPTCCELTDEMLAVVLTYNWMCMECKVCVKCSDPGNEDKMIVCDNCDRGYHTFCVGLKSIPEESTWACPECTASA